MPRFYYEYRRVIDGWATRHRHYIFDRTRGSDEAIAECFRSDDAERIVDALNGKAPG